MHLVIKILEQHLVKTFNYLAINVHHYPYNDVRLFVNLLLI